MGRFWILGWLIVTLSGRAAEEVFTVDQLLSHGRWLLEETGETNLLALFSQTDQDQVDRLLKQIRLRFQGEYVLELGALRRGVQQALPFLEQIPRLRQDAAWLRTRLDYFEVAEKLRLVVEPTAADSSPVENRPSLTDQQLAWRHTLSGRAAPGVSVDWLARLRAIFHQEGIPGELMWLAEVESSFNPKARSPAGAAGLYQLMPETARALGLSLHPTDERLEPEKNASAAARHLRYLYRRFNDWSLAVAAYNAGDGRVGRLLERHRTTKLSGILRRLPSETQMYVPKVDAVLWRRERSGLARLPAPSG
jgi:membrane-bound lytic murein transglycosylase D